MLRLVEKVDRIDLFAWILSVSQIEPFGIIYGIGDKANQERPRCCIGYDRRITETGVYRVLSESTIVQHGSTNGARAKPHTSDGYVIINTV